MNQMLWFQVEKRFINIPMEIGGNSYKFGVFLLKDSNLVRNIERKYRNDYSEINIAILEHWLNNGSQVTWKTLIETLIKIPLKNLARDIRDVVLPCSPSQ